MPWKQQVSDCDSITADCQPRPLDEGLPPYAGLSLPLEAGDTGYGRDAGIIGVAVCPLNQAQ